MDITSDPIYPGLSLMKLPKYVVLAWFLRYFKANIKNDFGFLVIKNDFG